MLLSRAIATDRTIDNVTAGGALQTRGHLLGLPSLVKRRSLFRQMNALADSIPLRDAPLLSSVLLLRHG